MVSSFWQVLIVVDKDSLQKWWYEGRVYLIEVIRMIDVSLDKFEHFLLDGSKSADPWCPSCNGTFGGNRIRDKLTAGSVECQHVKIDPAELRKKSSPNRNTYRDISLQYRTEHFNCVGTRQNTRIISGLSDDRIPSAVGCRHEACKHPCLTAAAGNVSDDKTAGLVKGVYLRRGKIVRDFVKVPNNFIDKGFMVVLLKDTHIPFAASSDNNERIAGHVLDTYDLAWSKKGRNLHVFHA